jgi:hypothetical protein
MTRCARATLISGVLIVLLAGRIPAFSSDAPNPSNGIDVHTKLVEEMKADFILPQVLEEHPGPIFYLKNSKALGLTSRQMRKIRRIAHQIIPVTLRQTSRIDELKKKYLEIMDQEVPPMGKARRLLNKIGSLEARSTADHLKAHLDCYRVLTPDQKKTFLSLRKKT